MTVRVLLPLALCVSFAAVSSLAPATAAAQPVRIRLLRDPPPVHVVRYRHPPPSLRPQIVGAPRYIPPPPQVTTPSDPLGRFRIGVSMGGAAVFESGRTHMSAAYRLNLGVDLGPVLFDIGFDLVPKAFERDQGDASLYTAAAMFGYRFIGEALVSPVVGLGIEAVLLRSAGADATGLAGVGRLGLELDYRTGNGTIIFGIDAQAHRMFAVTGESFDRVLSLVRLGASIAYRF